MTFSANCRYEGKNPNGRLGKNIRPTNCCPPPTKTAPIKTPTNKIITLSELTMSNNKRGFI